MDPTDRAVIFDMDGVLANTARAHYESWQAIAREEGVEIGWEAFHETFGRPNHEIIPRLLGRKVPAQELDRIDRRKEEVFRQVVQEKLEPLPGAVELIRGLAGAGFRIGLGSSGPPENIEAILGALGVRDYFSAVVSGKDVERGKPQPDVFLKVARKLGVEPGRCLVIEDVPAGIRAARRAGMKCVALTTTHEPAALGEAERVMDDLRGFSVRQAVEMLG